MNDQNSVAEILDDEVFTETRNRAMTPVAPAYPTLDLSFRQAATFLTRQAKQVCITVVGLGGTGSWIAAQVARTARVMIDAGRQAQVVFIDADRVSAANVPRSCFCEAETGELKVVALARRYSAAWGLEIGTIAEPFKPEMARVASNEDVLNVIIGCVDNAAARRALAEVLERRSPYGYYGGSAVSTVLIDCGNTRDCGQVLVGNVSRQEEMRGSFKGRLLCTTLPSPYLQHPELLEDLEEERSDHNLSCAELMRRNAQSLMVNHFVASIAGDYLVRLLVTKNLRRYATYFDLEACSTRNKYITPETLAAQIEREPEFLLTHASTSFSYVEDEGDEDYFEEAVDEEEQVTAE
jgi:PRTRC genetic system ThiF family protein